MVKPNVKSIALEQASALVIEGGIALSGKVSPDGAKNSCLYALIASTFMNDGLMSFENIPLITDIKMTLHTLEELGLSYNIVNKTIKIYGRVSNTDISDQYASKIRSSTTFLGALLSQFGQVSVPLPGGDKIGDRPIDIHMDVMKAFGANISIENGFVKASMDNKPLLASDIYLRYPSVGATINAIFMAITARGESTISNAAKEPEIVDLISLLSKMGADIHGGGSHKLIIRGVNKLNAANHDIMPDRLEAGALMMCFAMTGGSGSIHNSIPEHNAPLIHILKSSGIEVNVIDDVIHINASTPTKPFHVETQPYPGLATDLQAICTSYALICPEVSSIKDTVFENRFAHVQELRKMGANIEKTANKIMIHHNNNLTGAKVQGGDIRSVVSLILAALSIKDRSTISGVKHLLRGHVNFIDKIKQLNGNVELI